MSQKNSESAMKEQKLNEKKKLVSIYVNQSTIAQSHKKV